MLISSIVGNGTTAGGWGYQPWLPFYHFFPALIIASVLVACALFLFMGFKLTRAILWGSVFCTSGLYAVFVVYSLWDQLDLNPAQVFFWWSVSWILIMICQGYWIGIDRRVKEQIRDMEDREK